jgi:DNA-binding response OmpR family regulator
MSRVVPHHGVATLTPPRPIRSIPDRSAGGSIRPLDGLRILLVEDDVFVGMDISYLLAELGGAVIGPARTLADALRVSRQETFDLALLDVNLEGELSFALAIELLGRELPVLFVTAYASDDKLFPEDLKRVPRLGKPLHRQMLLNALRHLL